MQKKSSSIIEIEEDFLFSFDTEVRVLSTLFAMASTVYVRIFNV